MKTIKIELSDKLDYIDIVTLADLHFGDVNCDIERFKYWVDYIKNTENTFCILNGDLINNATKSSCSDIYSDLVRPSDQLKQVSEILMPIKDKILAITGGNHEFRTYKQDGIDLTEILARELGIADRYSPTSIVLFLSFGKNRHQRKMCYSMFINHGCGGGRKIGGKLNRLEDVANIVDADIYIHSHTHLPAIFKQSFYRTIPQHSKIEEVEKLFVNTNAFLNYGGYGETYEFNPPSRSVPMIRLDGHNRWMKAGM